MAALCRRLKPTSLEELAALIALYRPGPMKLIDDYIARKWGEPYTVLHPSMEEILRPTYGIMIYQEQIILLVQVIAGMTLAQADVLRRAIGKKKESLLKEQKELFVRGCAEKGNAEVAEPIWELIEEFAAYGFNKSHAMAYALLTVETAELKAHHPVEFMTASLNAEIGNAERIHELVNECRRLGIQVLPPHINKSKAGFSVEEIA